MIVISPIIRTILRIASFALFGITIFSAYGGCFNPHLHTFPSILNLAFPYLAMLSAIIIIAWMVSKRFITGGIGVVALACCWGPIQMAIPLRAKSEAQPGEQTFSLMSWNCLHLTDQKTENEVSEEAIRFLIDSKADIICCQELFKHDLDNIMKSDKRELLEKLYEIYPYIVSTESRDQSVFSKYPIERINLRVDQPVYKSAYSYYRVRIGRKFLTLGVAHLISFSLSDEERHLITGIHNSKTAKQSMEEFEGPIKGKMGFAYSERAESASELLSGLNEIKGPVIVCGDFNDVPSSWTYRIFLKEGFKDAFAETHFGPTHTYNAHMMLFHLDQIMYRGDIRPLWVNRMNISTSDHYPLISEFAFTNPQP